MGGRLYDPLTTRFFSPDPFVQLPDNSQSFNRYSYCLNNPLGYVDPTGLAFRAVDDWVVNLQTGEYQWMDNVTSPENTPDGYRYVGKNADDILTDLMANYIFPEQSSNRIGYIAADVEMGRYAVNHLINVKAKSNVFIGADITTDPSKGTVNNLFGRFFNGIIIYATVVGSHSAADGTVNASSSLSVEYGGETYATSMIEPPSPYIKQIGTSVAIGNVKIPASALNSTNYFSGVSISGGWWVTNPSNMRTPVVYHPLTPIPQTFKHRWVFPQR